MRNRCFFGGGTIYSDRIGLFTVRVETTQRSFSFAIAMESYEDAY